MLMCHQFACHSVIARERTQVRCEALEDDHLRLRLDLTFQTNICCIAILRQCALLGMAMHGCKAICLGMELCPAQSSYAIPHPVTYPGD